jgi:hypothetical protein
MPAKHSHENPPKRLRKSPKKKTRSTSKSQEGLRMNSKPYIQEEERLFTKRLATSQHPTHLKICLEAHYVKNCLW